MNIASESNPTSTLYCELCDFVQFSSYTEFQLHHLGHIRQPLVRLVKINSNLSAKLQLRSYKVNTGVARRSHHLEHVPPLKISLINQQGLKQFQVVKKERTHSGSISPDQNNCSDSGSSGSASSPKRSQLEENRRLAEVEGNNLLERFGANVSVSRKGKLSTKPVALDNTRDGTGNKKKETEGFNTTLDIKAENFLEKLSSVSGISISPKVKSSTNGGPESSTGFSISSKLKPINLDQLKKSKESIREQKILERNKLLEKLSEGGLISIAATKTSSKVEVNKSEGKESVGKGDKTEEEEATGKLGCKLSIKVVRSKSEDSNDSVDSKRSSDDLVKSGDDEREKSLSENSSESGSEHKRFVRVKKSSFNKKNNGLKKQKSLDESHTDVRTETPDDIRDSDNVPNETGIDILERLTENLNYTVGGKKSEIVEKSEEQISNSMEEPLLSPNLCGDEHQPGLPSSDSQLHCDDANGEVDCRLATDTNSKAEEQSCSMLLTPPSSSGQDGDNSGYNNHSTSIQNEAPYAESNNVSERSDEVNGNDVSFSSLGGEDQSEEQAEQDNSFWSDLRNRSGSVEESQQDSLIAAENSVQNGGETLNSNFLHNFLSDHSQSNSIPPENSEFMSLDRLAQTQHQQASYDLNAGDPNTPMEQLSQQVQRMPNPAPQINVIAQHHMQAPQPPQLHTGVPLSPQHISPQQPNSYDALSHMQPPMPPPLYQGFNMFSQNFSHQTPQQMPRPPILQQRPQIQARPFQSLAAPPRPRARGPKRNVVRLPPSHEMTPPKQPRRLDPPLQARSQIQNTKAKLPTGITVIPPKNAVEANKVANVLASRGITVTPAVSRQVNQAPRSQTKNTGQSPINILFGSGISITSSSQNKSSGGFAVPGPKRNTPIVNHHVERPERCTTVDLTQDDEPPQMSRNRMSLGRFPCKQCGKVFTSSVTLESHKATHRAAAALPYRCDKCPAQYTTAANLQQHKINFHKLKQSAPDLAIPIVDLNHPGAREQLLKCGVYNFIPLAQLQSNNNGYFGVPIIQLDTAKEKAVTNLSALGAGNIFVLGKMKALAPQPNQ